MPYIGQHHHRWIEQIVLFKALKHGILKYLTFHQFALKDDPYFLGKLRDSLLPHVTPYDEPSLRQLFLRVIKRHCAVSVREFVDTLRVKSLMDKSNDFQYVKYLYVNMSKTCLGMFRFIIHTGIYRHLNLMLEEVTFQSQINSLGVYTKSKLIELSLTGKLANIQIPVFMDISEESYMLLRNWYDEQKFLTSHISYETGPMECSTVSTIIEAMDSCFTGSTDKQRAISWLLWKLCEAIVKFDPKSIWKPILTGSAAESAQTFFIDEFDYVLMTNSKQIKHLVSRKTIFENAVTELIKVNNHPKLSLKSIQLTFDRYICLYVDYVDEIMRNTHISIDLVVATDLKKKVFLPHHNFLPLPRKQTVYKGDKAHSVESHEDGSTGPKLFSHWESRSWEIVFSQVENKLLLKLPAFVLEGYRLAKAFRIFRIILPTVPDLIRLGVTLNLHTQIRTYQLKTCVFFLTQQYTHDSSDIEGNNRWKWAIKIYEKLREFILLGNVKEFFATDRFIFRGEEQSCKHSKAAFTVILPRFHCCRVRKARLLIVDQILSVLREFQSL